ncbi:helix-turn-helix domain-containing protein, partial [Mycolicibacterium poriferae]
EQETAPPRRGYRLREIAGAYGIGLRTVQRAVADGELVAHRCGKVVLVTPADLAAWESTFQRVGGGAA